MDSVPDNAYSPTQILKVRSLERMVEGRTALAVDNPTLQSGDVLAVTGQIGGGKSLLVRPLCGDTKLERGEIPLMGHSLHTVAARKNIGILFE